MQSREDPENKLRKKMLNWAKRHAELLKTEKELKELSQDIAKRFTNLTKQIKDLLEDQAGG